MSAEVRRRQIMDAAAALVLAQGYLPLSLEKLAGQVGVSKGLIYEYFPTQADLFASLVGDEMGVLADAGIEAAAEGDLVAAAQGAADLYLQHIAARGPVAHFVLRDSYMKGRVMRTEVAVRDRLFRRFARAARRELRLPPAEATAAVVLVLAIPEEMGRLVWQGDMPLARGRELVSQLVASAIAALRPS
ncbi:MAG: helix-turn-helix domain-containing protein [Pseudomonadota bacterium]